MELTEKEMKIIELIGEGLTNVQIGEEVFYSEENIKKKIMQLRKRFKAKNRSQLAISFYKMKSDGLI